MRTPLLLWNEWQAARNPRERRADLEAVALLDEDIALDVEAILHAPGVIWY